MTDTADPSGRPPERDYVVVGGGSSGCVVAASLARGGATVTLLEQGERAEANPETLRADGYKEAFINDRLMIQRFSVPQAGCGGRRLFLGSGRGMGGSGGINAMVYTRGAREDFDAWGVGWGWDDVAGAFEEVERVLDVRRRAPTSFTETCIESAEHVGFRRKEDLNDGDLSGVLGYEWMNYRGADRRNSYVAFVRDSQPPTLEVRTGALARRVLLDERRAAAGVEYEADGVVRTVRARREVVVAAGALESPKLLALSGIGPAATLRAAGLDVLVDLPGVGANLHDHPNVTLFFLGRSDVDCEYPQLYGFAPLGARASAPDACFVFYPARSSLKEGMMRMLPAMLLPERGGQAPRLVRSAVGALFGRPLVERFVRRIFGIVVILGKPKSRGAVRPRSPHPRDAALIDPAYFAHPADLEAMVEGVSVARRLAAAPALDRFGARELIPGPMGVGRRGVESFVRSNSMTTYHYAGTCKMGDSGDADAVVDRRLRVRGVERLRVADASIMPVAPVAALNAPSMMIARRAARFCLEDAAR